jgi:hypothetical protein
MNQFDKGGCSRIFLAKRGTNRLDAALERVVVKAEFPGGSINPILSRHARSHTPQLFGNAGTSCARLPPAFELTTNGFESINGK